MKMKAMGRVLLLAFLQCAISKKHFIFFCFYCRGNEIKKFLGSKKTSLVISEPPSCWLAVGVSIIPRCFTQILRAKKT